MKHIFFLFILLYYFAFVPSAFGQTPTCKPVYGGGVHCSKEETKTTITPTKKLPQTTTKTKNAFPTYQTTKPAKTPATGPETIAMISLIPAMGIGIWLRKKTKKFDK